MITGRGIIFGRNQGKTPHDPLTIGSDAEHTLLAQVLSGVDAAATQKGHIQLAGELTGTAALPTITSTHSGSAHHAAITLGAGSDAALALSGQQLTLADVLTTLEHTNIGSGAPHHAQGTDTTLGTMAADVAMGTHKLTGLSVPVNAGDSIRATAKITEALLESATDLKHTIVTVTGPISLSGQEVGLKNDAAVAITEIDTGALANLDTVIPTSKVVTTSLAAKLNITSLVLPFYIAAGTLDTIPLTADQKLPFFDSVAAAKNIALTA